MTPTAASARASAATKSSMRCTRAPSSTTARMATLENIGSSRDDGASASVMRKRLCRASDANPLAVLVFFANPARRRRNGPCQRAWFALSRHGRLRQGAAPMAMTMNGEVQLNASREAVYAKLNDPEVLKGCIPGCEQLDKVSDTEFQAIATTKIGPVKAKWKGKVQLTDLDPPNGYRISGEGEGGIAGFAKGGAAVKLADKDGGTLLTYDVEAQIGGKLAQLGQRLIAGAAK